MVLAMSEAAEGMPPGGPRSAEAALLARCRAQDPLAFRAFVARHERLVFALLSRMLGASAPDLEDLAQETFLRAYRAFPGFDPDGVAKPSTWLLTIATRLVLDAKKRRRVGTAPLGDEAEARASDSTPELRAERRQLGAALAEAMDALPDDQRAALVLSDVHGLSTAEIASALEVPESTAKTRLFRARVKMREMLREEWRAS